VPDNMPTILPCSWASQC